MAKPAHVPPCNPQPDRLTAALRALLALLALRARRKPARRRARPSDHAARLSLLERDLQEVRTRVNALFFTVLAVALGDLVSRLVSP